MPRFLGSRRVALTLGAGLALAAGPALQGCARRPDPQARASSAPAPDHFGRVDAILEALVAGDVPATREPARWLSAHADRAYSHQAAPWLERMREEARTMLGLTDVLPVARAFGRIGTACASCHTELGADVRFPIELPPPTSPNVVEQMRRHAWAAERLWEGLAGPSNASWTAGAAALIGMPVDFGDNERAIRLVARLQDLAAQARAAVTPERRADVYGDLLETCALCHGTVRIGVP